jgi:fibrillarin-like pre-rRNA processing protein
MSLLRKYPGVYLLDDSLATKNLIPGKAVYGERLEVEAGVEYRLWNPRRSKLAAALIKGLREWPIKRDSRILYLGAASGTTASHLSDIASRGMVYCVEFSPRVFLKLLYLCEQRENMVPLLCDAAKPESYQFYLEKCDLVYQDLAQPRQAEILAENARYFLKTRGYAMMAVKARSIDASLPSRKIYSLEAKKLRKRGFRILELLDLSPYEKDHALILAQKLGY